MDNKRKGNFIQKELLLPIMGMVAAAIFFAVTVASLVAGVITVGLRIFENVGFIVAIVLGVASITVWLIAFRDYRRKKISGAANPALAGLQRDPTEATKALDRLDQDHRDHVMDDSGACRACKEILDAAVGRHDPAGTADFLELLEAVHRERMRGADPAFHHHYREIHAAIQEAAKGHPAMSAPAWFRNWPTDKR
jgi:hypothetical protein